MFCVKCGHPLKTNFKFCPKCGAKQPDVAAQHLPTDDGKGTWKFREAEGTGPVEVTDDNSSVAEIVMMTATQLSVSVRYESNGVTETVKLVPPCIIGRDYECLLRLTDMKVSQQHAKVYLENGTVIIEDLNSMNGTYVNGEKINEPVELLSGDEVIVGTTTLLFVVSTED